MQNTGSIAKSDSKDNSAKKYSSDTDLNRDTSPSSDAPAVGAAATVSQIKDTVAEKAHDFSAKAQEALGEYAHKAQEYGEKAVEETRSFVRRNPGQALLAGFGVGFILGYAISKR